MRSGIYGTLITSTLIFSTLLLMMVMGGNAALSNETKYIDCIPAPPKGFTGSGEENRKFCKDGEKHWRSAGFTGACFGKTTDVRATGSSTTVKSYRSTDKYRFEENKVFHQWKGREEYFYNKIRPLNFRLGQFISGNMRFVFQNKYTDGYVVVADSYGWKITYLECAVKLN
jgi:hypothetical protein